MSITGLKLIMPKKATKNYNLQVIDPSLSVEWHPFKNDNLTPKDVTPNSHKMVWWICNNKHEWPARVANRRGRGSGCPYCKGKAVCDDNCLATINYKLAKEWHPTKNGDLTPRDVTARSNRKIWWTCNKNHEWSATVYNRSKGSGCPYCNGQAVCDDNCLATLNSKLAKEWHPTKNGDLTPRDVTVKSNRKIWWTCNKNHEWPATVSSRSNGSDCTYCSGRSK